jgi:NitT/TauT family transport system ATP-binding protein
MRVGRGEFVAVVGPSGCGKSTLMKLISGLHRPQSGGVVVAGREVTGPVKSVGMAFQNPVMLPWRKTLSNVMLPLEVVEPYRRTFRRDKARHAERAEALLTRVGLTGFGDRYPWQLSGGMQQRASLCRALMHEPDLLMLDEPFAALDAFTREELWGVIQDLYEDRHFTCVLVTHELREAVYLADRVIVLSSRPARVLAERRVPFARPRALDLIYDHDFTDLVHDLRGIIAKARQGQEADVDPGLAA